MSNEPAVFSATYSDWKIVKTRRVVQVIFEIPLEAAGHAHNILDGMPDPESEKWFAIARLEKKPENAA